MEELPRILIVDDEPLNIDYLEQELEDLDYEVFSARNGKEALELVESQLPDMILLDIMMPIMDGFEVLAQLKSEKQWRDIPVVVISALSDMDNVVKGIELGAEDYLPKPFDPVLLQARIKSGLEKKRFRDLERLYLKALERELEIGREIQTDFLPDEIPQPEGWKIASYFQAAREVAGDFYDVFHLDERRLGLVVGDVCDKGVGSALYMALFRSLLRVTSDLTRFSTGLEEKSFERLLKSSVEFTNQYICSVHKSAMFASLFFGVLDPQSGSLSYINAGLDPPLIFREGKVIAELKPTGPIVGGIEDVDFKVAEAQLKPDDILLLYTDGITDAQSGEGEEFGRENVLAIAEEFSDSADSLINHIVLDLEAFIESAAQFDDITLMAVQRMG
ncbi:MAG: SpoIIE family protein phosphatase [Anaerolineaceae bacterium]|nr:MAG: SpoIIE family protein phosphatase [Anaerolineaceae bacterium]